MPTEERQKAIVAAVTPLIAAYGSGVTTAAMAEAAGVAEGTIYSVFPDKRSLIIAAVRSALDPVVVQEAFSAIDPEAGLEGKLLAAAGVLVERIEQVMALFDALRSIPGATDGSSRGHQFVADAEVAVTASLTDLITPHAGELAIEPKRVASALRGLVLSARHPLLPEELHLTVDEAVAVLLRGVTIREGS